MSFQRAIGVTLMLLLVSGTVCSHATAAERDNSRYGDRAGKSGKAGKAEPVPVKFPDTTRVAPKLTISSRLSATFNKLMKAYDADQTDKVVELADAILANSKANAFERARAAHVAGYALSAADDEQAATRSAAYMQKAIAEDALSNDDHFELMYMLAQTQIIEEQYTEGLVTLERFLTESKSEKASAYALKGNALYRMDRFEDAVSAFKKAAALDPEPNESVMKMLMAAYFDLDQPAEAAKVAEALVAKKPNDKTLLFNLANIYMQAELPQQAASTYDKIRQQGLLTESRDYESAYKTLANIDGREKEAVALINEGLEKKILAPSFEVYNFLGQAYYFSEQIDPAIAAWRQAAPLAVDGETYLNLAKVLTMEERYDDAKAAAKQALAKGVKKPGDAWMTIARAEYGEAGDNRAAILAAYREAAKYPETKAQAEKQIAQMSR